MSQRKTAVPPPQALPERVTEFEVTDGGTLSMAHFAEAHTRAEFYEGMVDGWSASPLDLAEEMDGLEPLAWALHSIYTEQREAIQADINTAELHAKRNKKRIVALQRRLKGLPEEPEDGAVGWLLGLTTAEFEAHVVPQIDHWFSQPPDWAFEDDYLPQSGTAQGAALDFFQEMDREKRELLGVNIIEGEHPGSTYYAAEFHGDVEEANAIAAADGIPVRFVYRP